MKLRFLTSIATSRGSYVEGQVIDVAALPDEFRAWLRSGVIEVVKDDAPEVAMLDPLGETATVPRGRPLRRRGGETRSSASRLARV